MIINTIFEIEKEYIQCIHLNPDEKLEELRRITGKEEIDFKDSNHIEILTDFFMKKSPKSDGNFLLWMYAIGSHIIGKFDGKWILIHHTGEGLNRHVPAVVNIDNDIWQVGDFCYLYYYQKKRMHGISFMTFYKFDIERVYWKPKYTDLNIPEENFIFIEN
tara:strand:+ start:103 stop:585 length:483 start_codon:yes stop_codon:yes gene_type:complete